MPSTAVRAHSAFFGYGGGGAAPGHRNSLKREALSSIRDMSVLLEDGGDVHSSMADAHSNADRTNTMNHVFPHRNPASAILAAAAADADVHVAADEHFCDTGNGKSNGNDEAEEMNIDCCGSALSGSPLAVDSSASFPSDFSWGKNDLSLSDIHRASGGGGSMALGVFGFELADDEEDAECNVTNAADRTGGDVPSEDVKSGGLLLVPAAALACSSPFSDGLSESGPSADAETDQEDEGRSPTGAAPTACLLMQEIREALESTADTPHTHPFLDMERQGMLLAAAQARRRVDYCMRMAQAAALRPADQHIATKILCHEAHRLQLMRAVRFNKAHGYSTDAEKDTNRKATTASTSGEEKAEGDAEAAFWASCKRRPLNYRCTTPLPQSCEAAVPAPTDAATTSSPSSKSPSSNSTKAGEEPAKDLARITAQWHRVKGYVESDLLSEGYPFIQRRLSCMCIFNAQSDDRPYSDNEDYRDARRQRQLEVLMRLDQQQFSGGNPYFLEEEHGASAGRTPL